jgi:GTP cyclohydrolase I
MRLTQSLLPPTDVNHEAVVAAVTTLLTALGHDPTRVGLRETPERVARFYTEQCAGPPPALTTFPSEGMDEMVVLGALPFYALCEHHLLPFFGTATIGYVPNGTLVGLSKIPRLLRYAARGVQTQERITQTVADLLATGLHPRGVGVVLHARHLCMEMRGVKLAGGQTTTSALLGVFLDDGRCRREFLDFDARQETRR